MKTLPDNVTFYKRTPEFTHESVPAGLLKNHSTKENVWGLIQVTQGKLEYVIEPDERHVLEPGIVGVIEPQIMHYVKPIENVVFFVEFYK